MKKLLFLFFVTAIFCSCIDSEEKLPIKETPELNYLALGDSYTIGESVHKTLRWPVQLSDSLRERDVPVNHPRIIARTGWTTADLLKAMDERLNDEKFDLVSVLIGVNNQYQGRSIEEYREDLKEIFRRAISRSNSGKDGVFAVSIPDYGVTPFGKEKAEEIRKEIDLFNAVFEETAAEFDIEFYNITPISRKAATDPSLTATDDLHPSGKMYTLWVQEIVKEIAEKTSGGN